MPPPPPSRAGAARKRARRLLVAAIVVHALTWMPLPEAWAMRFGKTMAMAALATGIGVIVAFVHLTSTMRE